MVAAAKVLKIAASQIGYQDNTGARFWSVLKPAWTGQPWCATFQQWINQQAGLSWIPGDYYCPAIENAARRDGEWLGAQSGAVRPGDLVLFHFGYNEAVHIERVERVLANGYLQTIGGNTSSGNAGSQNNGRGVWRRLRHRSQARGFVRQHCTQGAGKPRVDVDGVWGQQTTRGLQRVLHTPVDGIISSQPDWGLPIYGLQTVRHPHGSQLVAALQRTVGTKDDGMLGEGTIRHLQRHLGTPRDGRISRPTSQMVIALQRAINTGKL